MTKYEVVIGLEVHVHLSTKSKAFCGCSTTFGQPPNSSTCPVCLGLPGALPALNKEAFRCAMKVALALDCKIQEKVKFDRKNYYYPDLPKNYQISQYDKPVALNGYLDISSNGKERKIGITRVHLEEDAGKLIHDPNKNLSYVDFNRAGIPLLEIVSEPDMRNSDEACEYLKNLKAILLYLGVSNCNMEEGSLRCDANISLRRAGEKKLGAKVELKNMNSFKAVGLALMYEHTRQEGLLEKNSSIIQETRLWDSDKLYTVTMRTKEETQDYRYFPEPDLVPFFIDSKEIEGIKNTLPELPKQRKNRFINQYKLSKIEVDIIIMDKKVADYFEETVKLLNSPKTISNWLTGDIMSELNLENISIDKLGFTPKMLTELIELINNATISGKMAKGLLRECIEKRLPPKEIVKQKGLKQISGESELDSIIQKVIKENSKSVNDYKNGKTNAVMFLVGQVMRHTKGKANPVIVNKLLKKALDKTYER